jgi:hypothetical protein
MSVGTVAAFWAVSFLFVITPGADWAYAMAAGLRHRTVLPAVGGLLAGHLAATGAVAAGVATMVARSPTILAALTLAGAAYLIWLGVTTLTTRHCNGRCGAGERLAGQAGRRGRGRQRAQPQGLPAVPCAAAPVREPERAVARSGADHGSRTSARGQLRRCLHGGRRRGHGTCCGPSPPLQRS